MINKFIFLGPPGVGKGTLASKLSEEKGIKHISTGDIFRAEIKNKTELGLKVVDITSRGEYVPDEITNEIVKNVLTSKEIKDSGFLLDGYPRTINQAQFLIDEDLQPQKAILLEASTEVIIERLSGRRACTKCKQNYHIKYKQPKQENICDNDGETLVQRADDMPESIKKRLEVYEKQTKILIDFYKKQGILIKFNAEKKPNEIFEDIEKELF
ncbi:nucleoside monophosphate kinase [Mycoplasma marinum]|uniref:Adenylate kinase n=1 Tax=Mycoplasma marinum TaxID=1937190 RepID=A0A4V2NI62_9MOLU|nr:nucleoside monophosphate kinase [Mycoplasma marinum]TCG11128.1 adenylate kinase [Mycoplasma marinum]